MTAKLWQALLVVGVAATIAMNALANIVPFNGQTTGDVSDKYPVLFVPAGYVFSIWSVIYLGLIAYAIYQALPAQRDNPRLQRIRPWVLLNLVGNSVWLLLFHYQLIALSAAVIVLMLATLIVIYLKLEVGRTAISTAERWAVQVPFTLYLGWLTVATIANLTILLYSAGAGALGLGAANWAIVLLVVATIIAVTLTLKNQDPVYILVPVWAFAGIAVKQAAVPSVALVATVMAIVCGLVWLVVVARSWGRGGRLAPRMS